MAVPRDIDESDEKESKEEKKEPRFVIKKIKLPAKRSKPKAKSDLIARFSASLERFFKKTKSFLAHEKTKLFAAVLLLALLVSLAGSGISGAVLGSADGEEINASTLLPICQANLSSCTGQLQDLQTSVDSYKDLNDQLSDQVDDYADTIAARDLTISSCQSELADTESNLTSAQNELTTTTSSLTTCEGAKESLEDDYDVLAENFAKRYCCQLNALGFNYQAWAVVDNTIACLTSGTNTLDCS